MGKSQKLLSGLTEWLWGAPTLTLTCRTTLTVRPSSALPKSETRRVYNAVLNRYWYHGWWFCAHSIVRGGIDKVHIGIEVSRHTLGIDPAL